MDNIAQLRWNLPEGLDAALIRSSVNRRYYTGFPSSAGTLMVTREKSVLVIDSRYYEAARKKAAVDEVLLQDKIYPQLSALFEAHGVKTVGVEAEAVTLSEFAALQKHLPEAELVGAGELSELIGRQRMRKSAREIDLIRQAQSLTDEAFAFICEYIEPGMTEREIACELEFYARRQGSEGPAFDYIVAAGANSAVPHAVPGDYAVQKGDFIVLDFGCVVGGYRSDMTRTVAVGRPGEKQIEVYNLVLQAQLAALKVIKAGISCEAVDKVARDIIDATAYKGLFGHGLGHSLGLEIHESPRFSPVCSDPLPEGCVMSVEPGVYLPGEFGVRIEDIVAAAPEGCEILTKSGKELLIL